MLVLPVNISRLPTIGLYILSSNHSTAMLPSERRAAWSLALIYMVRMLGLFVILPVFSLFAEDYNHSSPFLIGLAIGIYGLFQAVLQIPFGLLSDRIGRKKAITLGLVLMVLGSVVAALADSIYWVIAGRALQGAGAVSAVLMALAADLSRDDQRTKMMAVLGASIGLSFLLSLLIGPLLIQAFSLKALFWLSALSALAAIAILYLVVPDPEQGGFSADTGASLLRVRDLVKMPALRQLDFSIFCLHLLITATFVAVPLLLRDAGLDPTTHWKVYLLAMLVALFFMVPSLIAAERYGLMRLVIFASIAGLLLTQLMFVLLPAQLPALIFAICCFFGFLSTLESLLPSLLSRFAPAGTRGSASGVYSSSQFFGAFVGGAGGGWLIGQGGFILLFCALAVVCVIWLFAVRGFQPPPRLASYRQRLTPSQLSDPTQTRGYLMNLPGVADALVSVDEGVAYMKIDKTLFQPPAH